MNWLIYTLGSVLLGSLSSILRRVIMKDDKSEALASVIFFQFMGFFIVLIFCIANQAALPNIAAHPFNYLAQGLLWGTASYCIFKGAKYLGAAETSILATFSSIITIITAIIFLNEVFTVMRTIGTALIILAVTLVSFQTKKIKLNIGIVYILLYCLASGIAITNDTYLLRDTNIYSLLMIGWLTPGIFLVLMQPKVVKKMGYFFHWERFKKLFLMTFVYAVGGIGFYLAITAGGQASQVNTISQSGVIVTTVMAALFLNERSHLGKKLLSAAIVVVGVILLS